MHALDRFLLDHGNSRLYVGTRLHGGIFSMQHGVSALIIQVDNRAAEIAKDQSGRPRQLVSVRGAGCAFLS
jgi:polysaccharide pyruvyl transferase WcaK-like protein